MLYYGVKNLLRANDIIDEVDSFLRNSSLAFQPETCLFSPYAGTATSSLHGSFLASFIGEHPLIYGRSAGVAFVSFLATTFDLLRVPLTSLFALA